MTALVVVFCLGLLGISVERDSSQTVRPYGGRPRKDGESK